MPECKKCGKNIYYIENQKGKKIPVDAQEIQIYVTGTQSLVRGHKPHECEDENVKM